MVTCRNTSCAPLRSNSSGGKVAPVCGTNLLQQDDVVFPFAQQFSDHGIALGQLLAQVPDAPFRKHSQCLTHTRFGWMQIRCNSRWVTNQQLREKTRTLTSSAWAILADQWTSRRWSAELGAKTGTAATHTMNYYANTLHQWHWRLMSRGASKRWISRKLHIQICMRSTHTHKKNANKAS